MSQTDPLTDPTETRYADPASRTTRALLACGVIAGPMYVVVSLIQALTREGFDLTRHSASILANGGPGWIQVLNLVLAGTMTVAAAVGLRRALRGRRGGTWGPRLIGAYGVSLIGAGSAPTRPTASRSGPRPGLAW